MISLFQLQQIFGALMNAPTFETALSARIDQMVEACTRCGKCVEACPSVAPAGIAEAAPPDVIGGVLDILRTGTGPEASRRWASACMLSGDCIKACDQDVNPRFLLAMARVALAKASNELPDRRRRGIETFRNLGRDVGTLSRLQLSGEDLVRLGQRARAAPVDPANDETPDFVFYTGCNVLKTPHIALLALDIMDALAISYRVMGGPTHCCGVVHMRAGDPETSGRMTTATVDKLSQSKSGVLAWCPSCFVQLTETTLPTVEKQRGAKPFELTPFMRFLVSRIEELKPLLRNPVNLRVALHRHPGVAGAMEAAEALLRAVPGLELVDLKQPAVGLQSVNLSVLPAYKREVQRKELEAARDAGIDALAAVYHSDHRELCAHERDWPFRIVNVLELIGQSMGLSEQDNYKRLKVLQDADAILNDCDDLIAQHGLDPGVAREVVIKGMLADQPLPLGGRS
jgi:heterodisulfide reductase subunit D